MATELSTNFIKNLIDSDLASGKVTKIVTRFPPEPNGYLHIGHAKAICLNFDIAKFYQGRCILRFDDTNPEKEEIAFVNAIKDDVKWLGYNWDKATYSSDYYEVLYDSAVKLINAGLAYVDSLSVEDIKLYRGSLSEPGRNSPFRDRAPQENLELFAKMRQGEFSEGTHVLRAKIDMSSGNINMRDPIMYRIRFAHHPRTKDKWCIYPLYDFAHPLSDALEEISHSLCSLEFLDHRPLYNWFRDNVKLGHSPEQTEFARLNLSHTITSKRKLKLLVDEGKVSGWDDPRMPTLSGMKKRGFPALAIRKFCQDLGYSRSDSLIDMSILEENVRENLNTTAKRAMAVLAPLKVIITNLEKDEILTVGDDEPREILFSREIYIDRDDFMAEPPKKFFRLAPGREVRLRHSYIIKCEKVIYDELGEVSQLHCTLDKDTLGKKPQDRKVKGVIHWVSVKNAKKIKLLQYDRLLATASPSDDFLNELNSKSLIEVSAWVEPMLVEQAYGSVLQFERIGYYCVNTISANEVTVYHRVVALRDSWAKINRD